MSFSIQTKLFVLMAGLTAAALFGVLLSISQVLSDAISEKVQYDFRTKVGDFRKQERARWDRLEETAFLIGENPAFKAHVKLKHPASVSQIVDEDFISFAQFDLFIVTDEVGTVLARFGEPDNHGDTLTGHASVRRALQGRIR